MTFVDANVFMYAVGSPHPLKEPARDFLFSSRREGRVLSTSAEVLQELLHFYLPAGRFETFDAAMALVSRFVSEVWPLEREDVELARQLAATYPRLQARDLCHLASCRRRGVRELKTFDRALDAAAPGLIGGS